MNYYVPDVLSRPLLSAVLAFLYGYAAFSLALWLNLWQNSLKGATTSVRFRAGISAACDLLLLATGLVLFLLTPHQNLQYSSIGLAIGILIAVATVYLPKRRPPAPFGKSDSRSHLRFRDSLLENGALLASAILLCAAIAVWRRSLPLAILLQGLGMFGILGVGWFISLGRMTRFPRRTAWYALAVTVGLALLECRLAYLVRSRNSMISLLCISFAVIYVVVGSALVSRTFRRRVGAE